MLIIVRVIRGRAWSGDTVPESGATVATLEFTGMDPLSVTEETETSSVNHSGRTSNFILKHGSEDKEPGGTDFTINAV